MASSHTQTDLKYFTDVSTSTSTTEIQEYLIKKAPLASIYTQTELKHLTDVSTTTNTTVIRETSTQTLRENDSTQASSLSTIQPQISNECEESEFLAAVFNGSDQSDADCEQGGSSSISKQYRKFEILHGPPNTGNMWLVRMTYLDFEGLDTGSPEVSWRRDCELNPEEKLYRDTHNLIIYPYKDEHFYCKDNCCIDNDDVSYSEGAVEILRKFSDEGIRFD